MPKGYSTQADYMSWVIKKANERQKSIESDLKQAFANHIKTHQVEVVMFSNVSALDLANAVAKYPSILKPLLAASNIAARAIERDLQIKNLNTYCPKLTDKQAAALAGYLKPFLPNHLEIPTLSNIDRIEFIDKEIRKAKGSWEKKILKSLNNFGKGSFRKRKFESGGEEFEIDAAYPTHSKIEIAIDVKRIEARRDIHKRCDEIVNKATKLKSIYPAAKFAAVIYYPFIDEHINVQNRLSSDNVDAVAFASEADDSIENAIKMLLARLKLIK